MFRVKIPFGRLGPEQLDALADVARPTSRGFGHVTTRQNVQLHFMKMAEMEAAMRRLDEAGLTTREACGNSVRNVTACELAEVCAERALRRDALRRGHRPPLPAASALEHLAAQVQDRLQRLRRTTAPTPPSTTSASSPSSRAACGFKVYAAGGLSTTPQAAITLHDFVPAAEIGRVGEAIVRLFHALGNRENKHRARLKYVLRKLGEPAFRAKYAEQRAAVDAEAAAELKLPAEPDATRPRPRATGRVRAPSGYLAWAARASSTSGRTATRRSTSRLFLGDITSAQLRALARHRAALRRRHVRLTIDQNIVIPWVDRRSLPTLYAELEAESASRARASTPRAT